MAVINRSLVLQGFILGSSLLAACVTQPSSSTSPTGDDPTATSTDDDIVDVCTSPADRYHCRAKIHRSALGHSQIQPFASATGFGPPDFASAYNFDPSKTVSATIAIVDAYGYTNLASDLATYRSNYGLPACTVASGCLTIVNSSGQTSPLPKQQKNSGWTIETALDVDMASAACPSCKIVVLQASSADQELDDANGVAGQMLGATVISNSWGGDYDSSSDPGYDSTDFNQPNVGIFIAAGDDGYDNGDGNADFPSTSSHVIAVGGTSLTKTSGGRGWSETAWSDGGSSCQVDTTNFPKPPWQTSAVASSVCAGRAASDVAAVADPNTGVAVYNTAEASGWTEVGGTSAASPLVAGIFALTGNGPNAKGQVVYTNTGAFYDVTSGTNGSCSGTKMCTAGTGWDGPTGWGSPNGAMLETITGAGSGSGSGSGEGSGSGSGSNEGSGSDQGSNDGSGSDQGSNDGSGSDGDGDNNGGNGNSGGGGGCSTTGGSGAATFAFVLGLALVRRRRRA